MPRPKENTKRTYVFLNENDFAALEKQAATEGGSISAILRRLAKKYISELDNMRVSEAEADFAALASAKPIAKRK